MSDENKQTQPEQDQPKSVPQRRESGFASSSVGTEKGLEQTFTVTRHTAGDRGRSLTSNLRIYIVYGVDGDRLVRVRHEVERADRRSETTSRETYTWHANKPDVIQAEVQSVTFGPDGNSGDTAFHQALPLGRAVDANALLAALNLKGDENAVYQFFVEYLPPEFGLQTLGR